MEAPLVVIVGPTASGKSKVAIDLAERFNGEIICADSRTIFIGMDIGTAKPSAKDQARVPHHGLDLVEPGQTFTAADFKDYALQKIAEIRARGRVPFLVGGTGLYIDSIIFDYEFGPAADPDVREVLNEKSTEELLQYCIENNIILPENEKNKRHLIRAIEQNGVNSKRLILPINNCIIVGITTEKEILHKRIHERSEHLFEAGVVEEAKALGEKYGWISEAMTGNVYRLVYEFLQENITKDELKEKFETADRQLAKRQLTWLKRNPFITWLPLEKVEQFVATHLA